MSTKTIDASMMRKNLSEALDTVRDTKSILLVKRRGNVESALIDIDMLEDLLAVQDPAYIKSIAEARASKEWYTPEEVFGDLWTDQAMKYKLKIESRARKDINSLDPIVQKRIAKKLKYYIKQSDPLQFAKKLVDSSGGDYHWRVGNYRVVFDVSAEEIRLLRVQHRKDVYTK